MKKFNVYLFSFLFLYGTSTTKAQSLIDVGVGISQQDNFAAQLTYRNQVTEKFRFGIQFQYGLPNYRFVSAITFQDKGYSTTLAAPLTFRINKDEAIQLSLFLKPGVRFQGVIDPDENNKNDSIFRSTAVIFEPGILINIPTTEKLSFQSGITFPIFYEVSPTVLFENQTTLLHGGMAYNTSDNSSAFLKANMGAAWGASGDSQKFLWSVQAGIRLSVGKNKGNDFNPLVECSL